MKMQTVYQTMSGGPNEGWNVPRRRRLVKGDTSTRTKQRLACTIKPTRVQSEPEVKHPPHDLAWLFSVSENPGWKEE